MRAYFGATGLSVIIEEQDKDKKKIECVVDDFKNPLLKLQILDYVPRRDIFTEEGFHMQCWPPNVSSRNSKKIFIYLDKERWNNLLTKCDSEAHCGWFGSRTKYDRTHFFYYGLKE